MCIQDEGVFGKSKKHIKINRKPDALAKFNKADEVRMALYVRAIPKPFQEKGYGYSSMHLAKDNCPNGFVACNIGNADNEQVTCALNLNECPITNLRIDTSGSSCDDIKGEHETCLDEFGTTKFLFSKEANASPLTHFKVEESRPCADNKFVSSSIEDYDPEVDNLYQVNEYSHLLDDGYFVGDP